MKPKIKSPILAEMGLATLFSRKLLNSSHDFFFHIISVFLNHLIKNIQTRIAPTFWLHIISHLFTKYYNFIRVCCFFSSKNLSYFVPPYWKLDNPYYHNEEPRTERPIIAGQINFKSLIFAPCSWAKEICHNEVCNFVSCTYKVI